MAAANRYGKKTFLPYDKVYLSTKTQYVTIMCFAISHDRISLKYSKIENMHEIRWGAHTSMKCNLYVGRWHCIQHKIIFPKNLIFIQNIFPYSLRTQSQGKIIYHTIFGLYGWKLVLRDLTRQGYREQVWYYSKTEWQLTFWLGLWNFTT